MAFDPSKYVLYLENWQAVVCLHEDCKYCMMPNGIELHLRRHHKTVYSLELRRQIQSYTKRLILVHPSAINIPMNMPLPIEGLKVWNGWQCKKCFKVGPGKTGGKEHCRGQHGWTSLQGKTIKLETCSN